jgi:hypothetical protein
MSADASGWYAVDGPVARDVVGSAMSTPTNDSVETIFASRGASISIVLLSFHF